MGGLRSSLFVEYDAEILEIENKLKELENERVYDLSRIKMDGSLTHNANLLREMIMELLKKIDNELPSGNDVIAPLFKKEND
ncbi:hypothetical protein [Alteribacillus sp. HJP-4]|uniref:hypothetical protein n=1 Tax=Alteribacillus sp. HJP-4 TaxID=2775394 RepID=UPI0035CD255E